VRPSDARYECITFNGRQHSCGQGMPATHGNVWTYVDIGGVTVSILVAPNIFFD